MKQVLKETRKAAGLTQQEIAQAVGITERTYRRCEAEKPYEPHVLTALRIAAVLGTTAEALWGGLLEQPAQGQEKAAQPKCVSQKQ